MELADSQDGWREKKFSRSSCDGKKKLAIRQFGVFLRAFVQGHSVGRYRICTLRYPTRGASGLASRHIDKVGCHQTFSLGCDLVFSFRQPGFLASFNQSIGSRLRNMDLPLDSIALL